MSADRQANPFEVTVEETRFLRRFVLRALLPWIAGVALLAGFALAVALLSPPSAPSSAAPVAVQTQAETSGRESELARLRVDLTALQRAFEAARSAPVAEVEAGSRQAEEANRALEARLRDAFESRVFRLEQAFGSRAAPVAREAAGDTAPALMGDLNAIRERLYNLEMRQDRKDQERAALQQDVLARLYELERSAESEAAARLENLHSGELRVEKLELRVERIEQQRGPSSAPAAPAASQ